MMGLFTLAIMMIPLLLSISPFVLFFMWVNYHIKRNEAINKLQFEKLKKNPKFSCLVRNGEDKN